VAEESAYSLSTTHRLEKQPHQLWAMLTLETARILERMNRGKSVGIFTFDKGTVLRNNLVWAMLTLETDRIFLTVNEQQAYEQLH